MMDNFNIRKFLTENKVTIVSQRLTEADSYGMPGSSVVKEKKSGEGSSAPKAPKAPKADGESKPKQPKAEGQEEEGTEEIDALIEQFKELSKDQKVAFAREVAKALKPKAKKEEVDEELKGGQKKLDKNKDGKISGDDFKMMDEEDDLSDLELPKEPEAPEGFGAPTKFGKDNQLDAILDKFEAGKISREEMEQQLQRIYGKPKNVISPSDSKTEDGEYEIDEKKNAKPTLNQSAGKRAEQIAQGAYDGRFKNKVIPDKKKEASKTWAKQK